MNFQPQIAASKMSKIVKTTNVIFTSKTGTKMIVKGVYGEEGFENGLYIFRCEDLKCNGGTGHPIAAIDSTK